MIKSINVKGLNGRHDFDLEFNDDLNIITGKNGCGKTSLMKLIWFLYSGNLYLAIEEVIFDSLEIEYNTVGNKNEIINIVKDDLVGEIYITRSSSASNESVYFEKLSTINKSLLGGASDSYFFPTFRRYEGGFSNLEENSVSKLKNALDSLSRSLSTMYAATEDYVYHTFVATIATNDIRALVASKYASMLDEINTIEMEQTRFILKGVKKISADAENALVQIQKKVKEVEKKKEAILRPFTTLSNLISEIFKSKGFSITKKINLGNTKEIISSDKLSAGEKQMLSFLCYNFFADNAVIFIDEPEISLHADWQRMLVPLLMEQNTGNQFFLATHSPFIYSKYPDKEIILDQDKGVTV